MQLYGRKIGTKPPAGSIHEISPRAPWVRIRQGITIPSCRPMNVAAELSVSFHSIKVRHVVKIDIHVHTRKVKEGDPPTREITPGRLSEIVLSTDVKII